MIPPARIKVDSLPACPNDIATVVAVPADGGSLIVGEEAHRADDASYLKLANWKMLLGKSNAELQTEMATNSDLANLLGKTTLYKLAQRLLQGNARTDARQRTRASRKAPNDHRYSPLSYRAPSQMEEDLQTPEMSASSKSSVTPSLDFGRSHSQSFNTT